MRGACIVSLMTCALAACSVVKPREPVEPPASPVFQTPAPPAVLPPQSSGAFDPFSVPDAIPKFEPRSRRGNPPFYEVLGKRYYVMSSSAGYAERGVASWYGPGFHAELTSIGEKYDMYGMTAAHKTLSLPTYVRVTNLQNQRSVIVRVNDRGPFVSTRIIDLSYTAAAKLDMLKSGTSFVEVRAIDPGANPIVAITPVTSALLTGADAAAAAKDEAPNAEGEAAPKKAAGAQAPANEAPRALFVQAGAFSKRANAEALARQLKSGNYGTVFVKEGNVAGRRVYRVRIGPVANVPAFDRTVKALERAGVKDAQLAAEDE